MELFNPSQFRACFPALTNETIYLDSAATALKPKVMIDATLDYYTNHTATALRSQHKHANYVNDILNQARDYAAKLISATSSSQIVWTKGTTESINLVAQSYARSVLQPGDEIIVSEMEHHSNLLPWLMIAKETGAKVIKWPISKTLTLELTTLKSLISSKTRIVAVTQMSNVTGYQPAIKAIAELVHQYNAVIIVDGAQGVVHRPFDVTETDVDFYTFSAHKLYGPTGLGLLYVKSELLEIMPIFLGGGKIIESVSFDGFTTVAAPVKFEPGTPNVAAIIGFFATLKWLSTVDLVQAESHVQKLADLAESKLSTIEGFKCYRASSSPLLTFNIEDIHHSDMAILLAEQNIALRTGELCAQPFMQVLGCNGVIRASFAAYNNQADIETLVECIKHSIALLK